MAGADAALASGLLAGEAYLSIHTTAFPSGETRGFLQAVPEPSGLLLLASGLVGFVGLARARPRRA